MPDKHLHVLVVDDSAVVRQAMTLLLGPRGDFSTSVAADPLIAMEKMKQRRPDVIVLDLEMPRMDGITFLR
jgi:two-component system chemotaxis response regulator CheB